MRMWQATIVQIGELLILKAPKSLNVEGTASFQKTTINRAGSSILVISAKTREKCLEVLIETVRTNI